MKLYQLIREDTLEETGAISQHKEHQVLPWRRQKKKKKQKNIIIHIC